MRRSCLGGRIFLFTSSKFFSIEGIMKNLEKWLEEYGESHQNKLNKSLHYICVPAIYCSIVGLLMAIPNASLAALLPGNHPVFENWASIALILVALFYFRLSPSMALKMIAFSLFCMIVNNWLGQHTNLLLFSLTLFAVGWLGQFYGHQVEGKKPSFLKDVQFLLIGPAWVAQNIFGNKSK